MKLPIKIEDGRWALHIKVPEHLVQEVAKFEYDAELDCMEIMWVMVKLSEDYDVVNGVTWDEISKAIWDEVDRVRPEV